VLIVGELGQLDGDHRVRIERLLTSTGTRGLRVLAASTDLGIAGDLAASFDSRAVYALDEEDSVRVLGSPEASGLPSDGSMLVRLAGRAEFIEAYQLRVPDDEMAALLAAMREGALAASTMVGSDGSASQAAPRAATTEADAIRPESESGLADRANGAASHVTDQEVAEPVDDRGDGRSVHDTVVQPSALETGPGEVQEGQVVPPPHIGRLLERAHPGQVVVQCLGGLGVWCRSDDGRARLLGPGTGPGQLRLNRQLDLLVYAAVHAGVGRATEHSGPARVSETDVRAELWNDAASKQIVGITARRLMADLERVGVRPTQPLLHVEHGQVALDDDSCLVDVGIFCGAVVAARAARGTDGLAAAEAAVSACGGRLLEDIASGIDDDEVARSSAPSRGGRPASGPLLGWTQELPAMSLASRLEAVYREVVSLLAVRLSDAEHWEDALHWAWVALRVGEIVTPDESERMGRVVLEAAAELHDVERLRGEYRALERRLEECGVVCPHILSGDTRTCTVCSSRVTSKSLAKGRASKRRSRHVAGGNDEPRRSPVCAASLRRSEVLSVEAVPDSTNTLRGSRATIVRRVRPLRGNAIKAGLGLGKWRMPRWARELVDGIWGSIRATGHREASKEVIFDDGWTRVYAPGPATDWFAEIEYLRVPWVEAAKAKAAATERPEASTRALQAPKSDYLPVAPPTNEATTPNTPKRQRLTRWQQLTLNTWRHAAAKLDRVLDPCALPARAAMHTVLATLRDVDDPMALFGRHNTAHPEFALIESLVRATPDAELNYDLLDTAFLYRWNELVADGNGPEELPPLRQHR
jgi:hypothetical protein